MTGARGSGVGGRPPRPPIPDPRSPIPSSSSCMNPSADCGGVSRPSSQACTATGTSCRWASAIAARRCWSRACTPPFPIKPMRWSVAPRCLTRRHSSTSGGSWKNSPDSIACEMRTMSCGTTRPAPRFRCPTSLLPICPSGSPTARPDALSNVRGAFAQRRCQVGVRPSSTALPSRPGRKPQPSSTIRTTGVRGPCLFAILEGMQSSRALRALPVVLGLVAPLPLAAEARYRVTTDGAWFCQEPGGKRLARLARGAVLMGGEAQGDWQGVMLEGWIFATSVGPTPRAGYDLTVTRAPEENLRSAPAGALIGKLPQGFLLTKVVEGTSGRWIHVTRAGWLEKTDLESVAQVASSRTAVPDSDTTQARPTPARKSGDPPTPGRGPGVGPPDTTSSPSPSAPVDPSRVESARRTVLYRSPEGQPAGTLAPSAPLRVLGRSGDWTRVELEGWVKSADLEIAPPGVLVGITAAELRTDPQRYAGQVLRWTLQFISTQQADELRPEIPNGATYMLARGPLPERGFVYVVVPEAKRAQLETITPLATIQVTARVRTGRTRFLGNPVLDMISLETLP